MTINTSATYHTLSYIFVIKTPLPLVWECAKGPKTWDLKRPFFICYPNDPRILTYKESESFSDTLEVSQHLDIISF